MKVCALMIALLVLVTAPAAAAPTNSAATCRSKLTKLQRQNRALQLKIRKLTAQRDEARGKLAIAQQGVSSALSTMTPAQIWPLLGNPIAGRFVTPQWSNSYFSSGPDYESWQFTRCGFCAG
jgi:type II secretory pathway pseudopilin PulG